MGKDLVRRIESDVIENVRSRIADDLLVIGSFLGVFGLATSLATINDLGWQFEHLGIGLAFLVYVFTAIFRHNLSYRLRAFVIIDVCFALGIFNYWGWGLIGSGAVWFLVTILYATVFLSKRAGEITFITVILTSVLFSLAVIFNWLPQRLDFVSYASSSSSWMARFAITFVLGWMMFIVVRHVLDLLQNQVENVHSKASALTAQATDLRAEILRRSDTESALETTIARLKFVDKSKNDFINQISHELRTPISNLKLYQDLLSRRPERANSYIPIMEEEIARITSIIEKMIISSELEEENELSTLVMINLGNLISWAIANVQNIAEKHQIHILFTSPHQDYRVWGALIQVQRAIIALLDNAIKYNAGIEIRIELREKHGFYGVSIANPTDFFLAEQSIFEPFVRGENALRLKIAGAGLGLSNARRIIEHYGGTIDINNLQIEGRNWIDFCVWLPMAKENT